MNGSVANEFVEGAIVSLKSGGPQMTVFGLEDDEVICDWFDKYDRATRKSFKRSQLVIGSGVPVMLMYLDRNQLEGDAP